MSDSKTAAPARRKKSFGEIYAKYGTFVILLIVCVIGSCLSSNFLKVSNLVNVIRQNSYLLILGFGSTFIMVVACINIAYDKMLSFMGCVACLVFVATKSLLLSAVITLVLGAVLGYSYGSLVTFANLPPFIVGLAISSICEGLVMVFTSGHSVNGVLNTSFTKIGQGYVGKVPVPIIIMLVVMALTWFLLKYTTFGRHAVAVGGNKSAAIAAGVRANRIIRLVYVLDGMTCAVASLIFMSRLGSGQPNPGSGFGFDAITGVVIGGASLNGGSGGALGTFVGIMIVGILTNIMNLLGMNSYYQAIAKGILIVAAVIIDMKTKQAIVKSAAK